MDPRDVDDVLKHGVSLCQLSRSALEYRETSLSTRTNEIIVVIVNIFLVTLLL